MRQTQLFSKSLPHSGCCQVGKNNDGNWVVRGPHDVYGGLFVSRAEAFRFAMFENGHRPQAVIMVPGTLELNLATA